MESRLAKEQKLALLRATQRLTPQQRLEAFLVHCRLMMDLYQAGTKRRTTELRHGS
jgi:hypothetical protein